jgi:hypothetical protein
VRHAGQPVEAPEVETVLNPFWQTSPMGMPRSDMSGGLSVSETGEINRNEEVGRGVNPRMPHPQFGRSFSETQIPTHPHHEDVVFNPESYERPRHGRTLTDPGGMMSHRFSVGGNDAEPWNQVRLFVIK